MKSSNGWKKNKARVKIGAKATTALDLHKFPLLLLLLLFLLIYSMKFLKSFMG